MNAMEFHNLRQVVRENCVALYLHHTGKPRMSWMAFSRLTKIGNGTAQRINELAADASLGTIDAIARAFDLQAWQLLIPHLDPTNPPVFVMTSAERRLYESLKGAAMKVCEQMPHYKAANKV